MVRYFRGGGGGFLKGGGVLKKPVEVLKEFDPLPPTLSVFPLENWSEAEGWFPKAGFWQMCLYPSAACSLTLKKGKSKWQMYLCPKKG